MRYPDNSAPELIQAAKYEQRGAYQREPHHIGRIRYSIADKLLRQDNLTAAQCLDYGGGCGAMASILADHGANVTVFDQVPLALRYARQGDPRLAVVEGRTELPFAEDSFDVVTMLECLEHVRDSEEIAALQEIQRVLADNGTLILSVPSDKRPVSTAHYRHYSLADIHEKIAWVGLHVTDTLPYRDLSSLLKLRLIGRAARIAAYGADLAYRKLTGSVGLVVCPPETADGFIVRAKK